MPRPHLLPLLFCALVLLCTGCRNPATEQATPLADPAQDSLLTYLSLLNRTPLRQAFAHLPRYTYRRTRETAYDESPGRRMGTQTRTVRFTGPPTARTAQTTAETNDGRLPDGFAAATAQEDTTALDGYMLPNEPVYLSPKGRAGYRFIRLPDTTLYGRPVQQLSVTARIGEKTPLRHARLYVEPTSKTLVGLDVQRVDVSLLFGEQSRFRLLLQPGPDAVWVPALTEVDTQIKTILGEPRRFHTTTTYTLE